LLDRLGPEEILRFLGDRMKHSRARVLFQSIVLVGLFVFLPGFAFGQTPVPDFNSGFTPFQAYHGGDLDSIDPAHGNLNLHIPLISFPQRGSRLKLNFAINYNSAMVKRPRLLRPA
jgi:hypothetical protein